MLVAVPHWQQKHPQRRKRHRSGDVPSWGFPVCLLPRAMALRALPKAEVIAKQDCCCLWPQGELAAVSSLGQNFLLLRSWKCLLDEAHWRNWHPESRSSSALGLPGSNAVLCWVPSRLDTLGTNPSRSWGTSSLETGSGRLSLPALPGTAENCTKRVSGVHFGILTPYFYLINASGLKSCFAFLPSLLTEGHKKTILKDSIFISPA